eukprot:1057389-Pleurochrysis_carterae.AAC.1
MLPTRSRLGGTERRGPCSPQHLPHSLREGRTRSAWVLVGAGRPGLIKKAFNDVATQQQARLDQTRLQNQQQVT